MEKAVTVQFLLIGSIPLCCINITLKLSVYKHNNYLENDNVSY